MKDVHERFERLVRNNDRQERLYRNASRGIKAGLVLFFLWFLFCASIVGTLIYVAAHFIAKVW